MTETQSVSNPFTAQRILAGIAALPLTAYGLLIAVSQLRLGFDLLGIAMGLGTLALATVCWGFVLYGHLPRARTRMKYALLGGVLVGGTGFVLGFFGPILLTPSANQGPLLGIFVSGPLGFFVGAVAGWIYSRTRG
jgi:hypothetical protein